MAIFASFNNSVTIFYSVTIFSVLAIKMVYHLANLAFSTYTKKDVIEYSYKILNLLVPTLGFWTYEIITGTTGYYPYDNFASFQNDLNNEFLLPGWYSLPSNIWFREHSID